MTDWIEIPRNGNRDTIQRTQTEAIEQLRNAVDKIVKHLNSKSNKSETNNS